VVGARASSSWNTISAKTLRILHGNRVPFAKDVEVFRGGREVSEGKITVIDMQLELERKGDDPQVPLTLFHGRRGKTPLRLTINIDWRGIYMAIREQDE
jgi:hypothetical protein